MKIATSVHYTFIGHTDACPDCVLLTAYPQDGSSAMQTTLFRKTNEPEALYWDRVHEAIEELVRPMRVSANIKILSQYDVPVIEDIEAHDHWQNYLNLLVNISKKDPSQVMRVKALCTLADIFIASEKQALNGTAVIQDAGQC